MAWLGNLFHRRSPRHAAKHARRLFLEPLEARQLMAVDLHVTKSDQQNGAPFIAGNGTPYSYLITVSNNGTEDATNLNVVDAIPPHTKNQHLSVSSLAPSTSPSFTIEDPNATHPSSAIASFDKLAPGETIELLLTIDVMSDAALDADINGTQVFIDNQVSAGAAQEDNPGDETASTHTQVIGQAQLSLSMTAPAMVNAGDDYTYTIQVFNGGASDAANAKVATFIPAGTTLVGVDLTGATGWALNPVVPNGTAGLQEIDFTKTDFVPNPPGPNVTIKFTVHVPLATADQTIIHNQATVSSATTDLTPGDNTTADVQTKVTGIPAADIVVTKSDSPDPVIAGDPNNLTYTITVTNSGTLPASGVTLTDVIPANTTFVSLTKPATWNRTDTIQPGDSTGTITVQDPNDMAVNEVATFTLVVHVNASATAGTKIKNKASADTSTTELNKDNNNQTAETTVQARADVTITKDDGITEVIAGNQVTYTITVTNTGPSAVVGTSEVQTATVAGTTGTFSLTFNGQTTSPLDFNASATLVEQALNDLTSIKPNGSVAVTQNGSTYTITFGGSLANQDVPQITASGAGGATVTMDTVTNGSGFVSIADTFPAELTNVTFTSTTSGGATGNTANSTGNVNDKVNMPPNSSVTYTVHGTVNPATSATSLNNTATATVPVGIVDPTSTGGVNSATDTDTITTATDVSVTISDAPDPITVDNVITYTILVKSTGPSNSGPVTLNTAVPANTKFVSLDLSNAPGWTADPGNPAVDGTGPVIASTPDMAPSPNPVTILLKVKVNTGTPNNTVITENVSITNAIDAPQTNNTAQTTTTVVAPQPDLVVTKSDTPDPVIAGQNITYTVTVTNQGLAAANNVVLNDTIPAGTTFFSITQKTGPSFSATSTPPSGGTGTITRTRSAGLLAGESASFEIIVKVNPGTISSVTNTASASTSTSPELNPSNNSATSTTTVNALADVSVTKSDSPDPIIVGSNISYTITVKNDGPSNATPTTLTDVLPANTTFVSMTPVSGWTITNPGVGNAGTVTAVNNSFGITTATFTLVVKVNPSTPSGTDIANTATVATTTTDSNPGNNSATTHTTALAQLDFGDAPASYGTLFADDGARHILTNGLHMGAGVDNETNGQPNATATGDDVAGIDDEDGVIVPGIIIAGQNAAVIVNASAAGKLDAWIDFNRNGVFDSTERIANSLAMSPGDNFVTFVVPAAASLGGSFARFRLSTAGGLGPTGSAADGEVEDYAVNIITVTPGTIQVLPNPQAPGENMLLIVGTAGDDNISVTQLRTYKLQYSVTMNGKTKSPINMADFRRVVIYGGDGNDTIKMNPSRNVTMYGEGGNDRLTGGSGFDELFGGPGADVISGGNGDDYLDGGEGNDSMSGGNGNDVLLGGLGADTMSGGNGRDLLIGGLDADRISGDAGDDILIGGTTAHDMNRTAINQIMAAWTNPRDSFATRLANLSPLLNSGTVFDDGAIDRLDGGRDQNNDWFLDYLNLDTIVNFTSRDKKN